MDEPQTGPSRDPKPIARAMSKYRQDFPNLDAPLLLTDGGLETTLVFHEGFDLPSFASFVLLDREDGRDALEAYYRQYARVAHFHGAGLLVDTPTWRAHRDWGAGLGYDAPALEAINRRAAALVAAVRDALPADQPPLAIGGSVGPRADGYRPGERMSPEEAEQYHTAQVRALAKSEADFISALTFNYTEEAIGVVRAARVAEMPVVLSFTVETDGQLPTGEKLGDAIEAVEAATDGYAAFYMVNCAHPTHFQETLFAAAAAGERWIERVGGVRSNASCMSHAELDEAQELDDGDPLVLGEEMARLGQRLGNVRVFGGCCGTDHRHIDAIAGALSAAAH